MLAINPINSQLHTCRYSNVKKQKNVSFKQKYNKLSEKSFNIIENLYNILKDAKSDLGKVSVEKNNYTVSLSNPLNAPAVMKKYDTNSATIIKIEEDKSLKTLNIFVDNLHNKEQLKMSVLMENKKNKAGNIEIPKGSIFDFDWKLQLFNKKYDEKYFDSIVEMYLK